MNPKEVFHNTAYSVQLPYIAGHYLKKKINSENVSTPQSRNLNVEFALKLWIYRTLKSLICLK